MVKGEHESELLDMAEVMQHAAQKVSVMRQVVDAAKGRLQEEMERSRCLEVPVHASTLLAYFTLEIHRVLGMVCESLCCIATGRGSLAQDPASVFG